MLDYFFQNAESLSYGGQFVFFIGFVFIISTIGVLIFMLIDGLYEHFDRIDKIEDELKSLKKKVGGKK